MKNLLSKMALLAIVSLMAFVYNSYSEENPNSKEVKILTNAHCAMCKTKIENKLKEDTGVINSQLDLKTKIVAVTYNPDKTTPEKLTQAISDAGYNAKVYAGKGTKLDAKSAKSCDMSGSKCEGKGSKSCCTGDKKSCDTKAK